MFFSWSNLSKSLSDTNNLIAYKPRINYWIPQAFMALATSPVNSLVPLACETMRKSGCVSSKSVFGVTSLDVVRTNTFVAEVQGLEPECVVVPVIGGNYGRTIVPVLSHARPCAEFTNVTYT